MKWLYFLFALFLVLLILLSGCPLDNSSGAAIETAKSQPEAQSFLTENQGAEIKATWIDRAALSAEELTKEITDSKNKCGYELTEPKYWRVDLQAPDKKIEVYVYKGLVICATETLKPCSAWNGLPCSESLKCSGSTVVASDITRCCIGGCVDFCYNVNCPVNKECVDGECVLIGRCDEIGGELCPLDKRCMGGVVESTDSTNSNRCCFGECTFESCSNLGGEFCYGSNLCSGSLVESMDPWDCCIGTCYSEEFSECDLVSCSSNEKCVGGECVLKSCSEIGGKFCASIQWCTGDLVTTRDDRECCLGNCITTDPCASVNCASDKKCVNGSCVLKSCSERGGDICTGSESCSGSTVTTSDSSECCIGSCTTVDQCVNVTCNDNKKCVDGKCVLKTCNEQSIATLCNAQSQCYGFSGITLPSEYDFIEASDTDYCCPYKCGNGDIFIAGPLELNELMSYESILFDFHNTFTDLGGGLGPYISEIKFEVYINGQLQTGAGPAITDEAGNSRAMVSGIQRAKIYVCRNCGLEGKTARIVIDPDNELAETNENNNTFEGTVS